MRCAISLPSSLLVEAESHRKVKRNTAKHGLTFQRDAVTVAKRVEKISWMVKVGRRRLAGMWEEVHCSSIHSRRHKRTLCESEACSTSPGRTALHQAAALSLSSHIPGDRENSSMTGCYQSKVTSGSTIYSLLSPQPWRLSLLTSQSAVAEKDQGISEQLQTCYCALLVKLRNSTNEQFLSVNVSPLCP